MFDQAFIDEVEQLALQIAKRARNEDYLQSLDILFEKFHHECQELQEAPEKWDEIPDIVYYAACAVAQGSPFLIRASLHHLKAHGVPFAQAKAATLAKYRLRAAGHPKDIEAERAAILLAIAEV